MRWIILVPLAVGCSKGAGDTGGTTPDPLEYSEDFAGVEALIIERCQGCHVDGAQAEVLPLPESLALDLVSGAGALVVPGDPEASKLWRVVSDTLEPGDYGAMPDGTGPLPPSQRDHVRTWIADGAEHPYASEDLDGDGYSTDQGDCDETRTAVFPGANEVCGDGIDNDCSGDADGPDAINAESWYADADGDGHGDLYATAVLSCDPVAGSAQTADDCDDLAPAVHAGAPELQNGTDDDCDGYTDETTSHLDDIQPLYASYCSCHISGIAPVMDLSGDAYDQVVGVASDQVPAMNRVEPWDPANSYLWNKINGTQAAVGGSGDQMPLLAPPLDPPTLDLIEAWILEGAPP